MKLRSKTTYSSEYVNNHLRWAILPTEIRLMILEQVEIGYKGHDLSDWVSVSREWQAFFEARIFQRLRLRYPGSDIDNLSSFVHGDRRDLVKEILLHVSLEEYDNVNKFDEPETRDTINTNNKLFSQALKKLFISLSTWSTPRCGVKLRLSASSPSDSGHPWAHRAEASQHGRRRVYSSKSKQRLLGNLLNTSSGTLKLSQVPIVRKLFVNQYCYRSMSKALLAKVLGSLCRLRTVSYEPWHAIAQYEQFPRDEAMIMLLDRAARISTMSSVHVWEAQSTLNGSPRFLRMRNDDLVSSAVNASYRLRFLTLCHAVDATDFFRHSSRDILENTSELSDSLRAWPALTHLALTTCIGDLVSNPSALDRLLLQASRAALRMPLLKKMEIWAPGAREGFILRYHVQRGSPFLTVIATWQLKLTKEALRSWERVAAGCSERGLTCNVRLVKTETTMSDSPYALCHMLALFPQLREWKSLSNL